MLPIPATVRCVLVRHCDFYVYCFSLPLNGNHIRKRYKINIYLHQSTNVGKCCQSDKGSGDHVAEEQVKKWLSLA